MLRDQLILGQRPNVLDWFRVGRPRRSVNLQGVGVMPVVGTVGAALQRLPDEHRDFLVTRFGRGHSVEQIAGASQASRAAVSVRQLLALRALHRELESSASGR